MLDRFAIITKGGILLWCFTGAGLLPDDLKNFRPTVNEFIKTVLLQEMTAKNLTYESPNNSMAIKYRLDNEFELVFIAGYQKMLPLLYLDKLLDEIQRRFRDKFENELKKARSDSGLFAGFRGDHGGRFDADFEKLLRKVEHDSKAKEQKKKGEMRTYEESTKSKKTIASMIEKTTTNNNDKEKQPQQQQQQQQQQQEVRNEDVSVMEARQKMQMKMRKGPGNKAKSPKAEKKGKTATTWDPFMFGGKGATGAEAKSLERGPKPGSNKNNSSEDEEEIDRQMNDFVPDRSVIGASKQIVTMALDESDSDQEEEEAEKKKSGGGFWGGLSSLVSNKSLTRDDIEPVIAQLKDHLIAKNVAADVAAKLCDSVANNLEGKVLGT